MYILKNYLLFLPFNLIFYCALELARGQVAGVNFINTNVSFVFSGEINSSCDMTNNFCDINCCTDPDCSEKDKEAFICTSSNDFNVELIQYMNCSNEEFMRNSFLGPAVCLHDHNTPYLGEYYRKDVKLLRNEDVSEVLSAIMESVNSFKNKRREESRPRSGYKFGVPIQIIGLYKVKENLVIPSQIFSSDSCGYCSKASPLRFLMPLNSRCYHSISSEQCLLNSLFNVQNFIKKYNKTIRVDDGFGNALELDIFINCESNGFKYISSFSDIFKHVKSTTKNFFKKCRPTLVPNYTPQNGGVCENVVVSAKYNISTNHTKVTKVTLAITLADIPVPSESFISTSDLMKEQDMMFRKGEKEEKSSMYIIQNIQVNFDNLKKAKRRRIGYSFGDLLFIKKII